MILALPETIPFKPKRRRRRLRLLLDGVVTCGLIWLAILWHYYPSRVDPPEAIHFEPTPEQQVYYNEAYDAQQAKYAAIAARNAGIYRIKETVQDFAAANHLSKGRVLEIGSGEGSLQDVVDDYTGLDISATVRRHYHKRFVQADARAIPFPDGAFDGVWSIWVLEHIPNPEQALREMRRVLKPGGVLLLYPAWLVPDYAAEGYSVRPYSDFGIAGKLRKLVIPFEKSPVSEALYELPIRTARLTAWSLHHQPTKFRYRPLKANYDRYWMADSDAVNSMDMFEAYLWFVSRGDECLNCGSRSEMLRTKEMPLMIRVKPAAR